MSGCLTAVNGFLVVVSLLWGLATLSGELEKRYLWVSGVLFMLGSLVWSLLPQSCNRMRFLFQRAACCGTAGTFESIRSAPDDQSR